LWLEKGSLVVSAFPKGVGFLDEEPSEFAQSTMFIGCDALKVLDLDFKCLLETLSAPLWYVSVTP
jgi:hypothetical protein